MALLFGKQLLHKASSAIYTITDMLILEQSAGPFHVEVTANGSEQLRAFISTNEGVLVCLGWAHSHHQVAIVTQGRKPSQADIQQQHWLKTSFPTANIMLILNEEGWDAFTLPHPSTELLRQHNGQCSGFSDKIDPATLAQRATFLKWLGKSDERVIVHSLGKTVVPIASSPGVCSHADNVVSNIVASAGPSSSSSSINLSKCQTCDGAVPSDAEWCPHCGGARCKACRATMPRKARFCPSCGHRAE